MVEDTNQLSAAELKLAAPFLRMDAVQRGDVLLTSQNTFRARSIAWWTFGEFSHSAIWLPMQGQSALQLVESDGHGIGSTWFAPIAMWLSRDEVWDLRQLPPSTTRFKLLRHSRIAEVSLDRIESASRKLVERYFHKSYSRFSRLTYPVRRVPALVTRARGLVEKIEKLQDLPTNAGPFCSELVAYFFEEVGLPLLLQDFDPKEISPNDLDVTRSHLEEVPNAFLLGNDVPNHAVAHTNTSMDPILRRKTMLPALVVTTQRAMDVNDNIAGLLLSVQSFTHTVAAKHEETTAAWFSQIMETAQRARSGEPYLDLARLQWLALAQAQQMHLAHHMASQTQASVGEVGSTSDGAPVTAPLGALWLLSTLIAVEIQYDYSRHQCLAVLRVCRAIRRSRASTPAERRRGEKAARLTSRKWLEMRQSLRGDLQNLSSTYDSISQSDVSREYIDKVLTEARTLAWSTFEASVSTSTS